MQEMRRRRVSQISLVIAGKTGYSISRGNMRGYPAHNEKAIFDSSLVALR